MLRKELEDRGHARSYYQIVLSLNILAGSIIEIGTIDDNMVRAVSKVAIFQTIVGIKKQTSRRP